MAITSETSRTDLQTYVAAHNEYRAAKVALGQAQERHNRAQIASQDAWRVIRMNVVNGITKPGIHAVGQGRAIRIGTADYPEIEDLFLSDVR